MATHKTLPADVLDHGLDLNAIQPDRLR
jgi:hypothetical protein